MDQPSIAAKVAGWGPAALPELAPLAGGVTGATMLLRDATGEHQPVVVRTFNADSAWVPGFDLVKVSYAFDKSGVGPRVLAHSDSLVIYEYLNGAAATIDDVIIADGEVDRVSRKQDPAFSAAQTIASIGASIGRLHRCAAPTEGGSVDEMLLWRDLALQAVDRFGANHPENDAAAVASRSFKQLTAAELDAGRRFNVYAHLDNGIASPILLDDTAWVVKTLTHGDMHLGNMLLIAPEGNVRLVDVDRAINRRPSTDLAYLFMTWSDQYYQRGYPFASAVPPYVPLTTRRRLCEAYLSERGCASEVTRSVVDSLLYDVEKVAYSEKMRFFFILVVMCGGDLSSMLGGFALAGFSSILPGIRAVLEQVESSAGASSAHELKERIVEKGIFAVAAAAPPRS